MKIALWFSLVACSFAQTASLRGRVTDQTGAVVPGAIVALRGPAVKTASAGQDGTYEFTALAPGEYTLEASAPNLALPEPLKLTLAAGSRTLDLELAVSLATERVSVQDKPGPAVSADPSANATALTIRGAGLDALADDPEDLAADLQALAGPSAGPDGGAIFIDGFSGGQLPSKESIREIRINQNPFSPEYDKLGYGRIDIFTKPGTEKFRGMGYYNFADDFWNSRNPYAARKAPFFLKEYGGSLSGPLNERGSYFLDIRRDSIDNGAVINGSTIDPATLDVVDPYTDVFNIPQRRVTVSPRVDYQLSANHTLTARYQFLRADVRDSGVGSFNLPSRGSHARNLSETAQLTETAVLGASVVNESRFQFVRLDSSNIANSDEPAIQVLGAFNGGGAPVGQSSQTQNSYEFQNYTSVARRGHTVRFGARLRGETVDSASPQNFNGTFTFAGAPGLTSIEQYRRTLLLARTGYSPAGIRALGGGPAQFTITAGNPYLSAGQMDAGLFAGDDWRLRPNLTLSFGLRYEAQSNIHDWHDLAPRAGIAWAPGKSRPKGVLRAGFGAFYDRFPLVSTMTALRYNGILERQYAIDNPDFFPAVPALSSLASAPSVVENVSPALRAPYIMQFAGGYERQLPLHTTVALTFANSHGERMLRSRAFPAANAGPVFEMESSGVYNQRQMIVNVNSRVNDKVSLFGSYVLNRALSDTDGVNTFPANPYDLSGEYGPAATDVRHRGSFGGSIETKGGVRLNPLFVVESGPPFDITAGHDLYGTTLFNARPGIAADPSKPGVIVTRYGLLDPNPSPSEPLLPRNCGRGPGSVALNLRIAKVFAFGRGEGHEAPSNIPGGGERRAADAGVFTAAASGQGARASRRYLVTISMSIRNVLNHNNPGPIVGNITSPLFGRANQPAGTPLPGGVGFSEAANNRRLELQTRFTF